MATRPTVVDDWQDVDDWEDDLGASLKGAEIKPQPSFFERLAQGAKGFAQEIPLVSFRGANLAYDALQGRKPWDPEVAAERASREQQFNELLGLGGAAAGEDEQRTGRILARLVPQVAIGAASSGLSLPAQAAIQGGAQALQSASEGASPEAILTGGGIAAVAPYAGKAVNAVASKARAPFASSVNAATRAAAERLGIELPAGAMTDSPLARGLEQGASRAWGGGRIEERGVEALEDIQNAARNMAAGADEGVAGQMIADDYSTRRAGLQDAKNAEYGRVGDLTATEIPEDIRQTADFGEGLLQQGTLASDEQARVRDILRKVLPEEPKIPPEVQEELDKLSGNPQLQQQLIADAIADGRIKPARPRSVAELMSAQADIEYGGPNALREAALGNRFRGLLNEDYTQALELANPGQAAQLAKAKEAYGRYADFSQSELGEVASKGAEKGTYSTITNRLLRSNAAREDLKRLMDMSTPATQDQIRLSFLQRVVGRSKDLTPKQIESALENYKNADVVLTPDQIQRLRDLAQVSKMMAKTRIGSPTEPLQQVRRYLATPSRAAVAAGAAALGGPVTPLIALAAELGGETTISKWLGSPRGQRWLLEGFDPVTKPGAVMRTAFSAGSRLPSEIQMDERRRRVDDLLSAR